MVSKKYHEYYNFGCKNWLDQEEKRIEAKVDFVQKLVDINADDDAATFIQSKQAKKIAEKNLEKAKRDKYNKLFLPFLTLLFVTYEGRLETS